MKILGLDISSISTGWSIIDQKEVCYGTIKNDPKDSLLTKIKNFGQELENILCENKDIKWIGIEDIYNNNTNTIKTLSKFAGVALYCIRNNLFISDIYDDISLEKAFCMKRKAVPTCGVINISPSQVLKFIELKNIPDRDDKKAEVLAWANNYFDLNLTIEDNDISDSLAISVGVRNRIERHLKNGDIIRDRT